MSNANRKLLKRNAIPQLHLPSASGLTSEVHAIIMVDAAVQCDDDSQTNTQLDLSNDNHKRKLSSEDQKGRKKSKKEKYTQSDANMFDDLCDKLLTPHLARIVKQQTKVKTRGNKFSLDYKVFCLNLYHVSPQAYSLLKYTLSLPSKQTLMKMYMSVTTTVDNQLMDVLQMKSQYMSDIDRNCTLVVGSMSVKANLFYHVKEDRIFGFHEVNGIQTPEPAKYALVAMIHGLHENYELPVGFALVAECKNYLTVTDWIDKLILKLFSIGFHVRCLVSDMDSDFLNRNTVSAETHVHSVGGRKIYHIFDPPQLFKLVRNDLISNEFHFENQVAKWEHILQFYEMDKLKRLRLAPKITDSHIKPTNCEKMEYAVQVLSATVAAGLSAYRDFGIVDNSAEGTVKLIEIMNDLFDFLNTSSRVGKTQYQNAFCGKEYQTNFVNNMLDFLSSLKLINLSNGQNVTSKGRFIESFQITLKSILMLFEDLKTEGFSYVLTRRLNQECLENFFGRIRAEHGNSAEPTYWQLIAEFRKVFFKNILNSPESGNCTEDIAKCLLDGEKLYGPNEPLANEADDETTSTMLSNRKEICAKINTISTAEYNTLVLPENNALVYVSGYLLGKCLDHHNDCDELVAYTNGENIQGTTFACYKDYCKDATEPLSTIPPDSFVDFVSSMEEIFCNFFEWNYLNCEILKSLLNEVQTLTFSMPCECFPLDYCKILYMRMRIYYTLKYNNRVFRQCGNRRKIFSVTNLVYQ